MSSVEESLFISQFLAAFAGQATKYPANFVSPGLAPNWTSKRATFERPAKAAKAVTAQGDIQVTVKSLKAGQWTVDVSAQGTITDLKEALQAKAGIEVNTQRLVLKGKALIDTKTLEEYGITAGSTVHLFSKAGGAITPSTPSSPATSSSATTATTSTTPTSTAETASAAAVTSSSAPVAALPVEAVPAPKKAVVTTYRGLSEQGTDQARDAEFWYWLNDQLKDRLGSQEDASAMMKGFLGQYRDLIGNAVTKEIETEIKK